MINKKNELMLRIEHVSKQYNLGTIGGGTLKADIQSKLAKLMRKEDPNLKIGQTAHDKNETFLALDDINIEIKKGERIGIIGHNGAGKSTLLKLICRVTAPTVGCIYLNGRITSMLEVGTGFHPELTGRENIYMNGAILGMTKDEIDSKFDEIVEFSEIGKFIDTPIKRYSSGMNVKLGFSVASHLDSEIMIMDEVLAVGDMAFQNKCLSRMREVAENEGRTILYVSHNMATIRNLCERVIVLEHGKVIFDGEVEDGIAKYLGIKSETAVSYSFEGVPRLSERNKNIEILSLDIMGKEKSIFECSETATLLLRCKANKDVKNVRFRFEFTTHNDTVAGTAFTADSFSAEAQDEMTFRLQLPLNNFAPGKYYVSILPFVFDEDGNIDDTDNISPAMFMQVTDDSPGHIKWLGEWWGNVRFDDIKAELV